MYGANGYLLEQFLQTGTNKRTDAYGGSVTGRVRLLREVTGAVIEVWAADRVGVRLAPGGSFADMHDAPVETYQHAIKTPRRMRVGLPARCRDLPGDATPVVGHVGGPTALARSVFSGTIITNGEYDRDSAEQVLASGDADLVACGRPFLANPDLPERFRVGAALNEGDHATFYGGDEAGYID